MAEQAAQETTLASERERVLAAAFGCNGMKYMSREQRHGSHVKSSVREVIEQFKSAPWRMPEHSVRYLLKNLCVELGYCLPSEVQDRIADNPPENPESFAALVVTSEGLNPEDSSKFDSVLEHVCGVFVREWSSAQQAVPADRPKTGSG